MQQVITFIVVWLIVPIILLGIIILAGSIVRRTQEGEHRLSVRAGYWAGLVAFVAFVAHEIDSFRVPDFGMPVSIHLGFASYLIGGVIGFIMLLVLKHLIPTRMGGFVVLLLVFSGASSLFSYFFIQEINEFLLSLTLGIALGALIHVVVSPKLIQDIFANND